MSSKLAVSLVVCLSLLAFGFAWAQLESEERAMRREFERDAASMADTLRASFDAHDLGALTKIVKGMRARTPFEGVALYDPKGAVLAVTRGLDLTKLPSVTLAGMSQFAQVNDALWYLYSIPLSRDDERVGTLAIFQDASGIATRIAALRKSLMLRATLETLLGTLITLIIVRVIVHRPLESTVKWMRDLRTGKVAQPPPAASSEPEILQPLHKEMHRFAQQLQKARDTAEQEARLRHAGESIWTAARLKEHVRAKLADSKLFVLSNREPYSHVHKGKGIQVVQPPSGLVTAIEPILRACDGVWVAHGSGDADAQVVDAHDRLAVPPDHPEYLLRRVWLSKEEEDGYYYGYANEGLWPLCHIAHTRPLFRTEDWRFYREVNEKFARVLLEEMADTPEPGVLIQDYHFALVPRLIKDQRPDARVSIFWHIPWPNPEAFGICPQQEELLDGLLGADLIGFHIQAHCINFLETVKQVLESRVELERSAVNRNGHTSLVHPFPISVNFSESNPEAAVDFRAERAALLQDLGIETRWIGVGVDRVDYTKGILERFAGLEAFFENQPEYRGQVAFVQAGAPSRMNIKRYKDLYTEAEQEAERINRKYQQGRWKPIVFLNRSVSHAEVAKLYHAADFCMVTSLHDGMNLVAKEFVAAREDELGVLILSTFTGASRELQDALLVNPYDTPQLAEAIRQAVEMSESEQRQRMHEMRREVRENNIYKWAANFTGELADLRMERTQPQPSPPEKAVLAA